MLSMTHALLAEFMLGVCYPDTTTQPRVKGKGLVIRLWVRHAHNVSVIKYITMTLPTRGGNHSSKLAWKLGRRLAVAGSGGRKECFMVHELPGCVLAALL